MSITLIAAIANNDVIGNNNDLPWPKLKKDFKHFKAKTLNSIVVMGRKTYESLPNGALPKRENYVLSKNMKETDEVKVFRNIDSLIEELPEEAETFIIGGANIYNQFLDYADCLEITHIYKNFTGDTYFPKIDKDKWEITNESDLIEEEDIRYKFITYSRI